MLKSLLFSMLFISSAALAHPDGTYILDGKENVTVTFKHLGKCPTDKNSMKGGVKSLTFTEDAEKEPYNFISGHYVEIHSDEGEEYVRTTDKCVPVGVPASRSEFGGFSLKRKTSN